MMFKMLIPKKRRFRRFVVRGTPSNTPVCKIVACPSSRESLDNGERGLHDRVIK